MPLFMKAQNFSVCLISLLLSGVASPSIGVAEQAMEPWQHAVTLNNQGLEFESQGRFEEAAHNYEKAISLDPNLAIAYSNRGNLLFQSKDYKKAADYFKKAIRLKPEVAAFHINLANTFYSQGHYDKAISEYQVALKLDEKNALGHANLGDAFMKKGSYELSRYHLEQALTLNHQLVLARYNLGELALEEKKWPEAKGHFLEVLKQVADFQNVHFHLAKIFEDEYNVDLALRHYKIYLELNPQGKKAADAVARGRALVTQSLRAHTENDMTDGVPK